MSRSNIYFIIALLLPFLVKAEQLSLTGILELVEANHPYRLMYDNNVKAHEVAADGAYSWSAPMLGIGQFMTPYDIRLWRRNGNRLGLGSVMFMAEQMLANRGKQQAQYSYMKSLAEIEKANKKAYVNDIIQETKLAYYQWVIMQKKLHVLEDNATIFRTMLNNIETRYSNGIIKMEVYYQIKATIGEIKLKISNTQNTIDEKRIYLNVLMGRSPDILFTIDTTYAWKDYDNKFFDSTLFYTRRSDMQSLDGQIQSMYLKSKVDKEELKPQFGIRLDNMFGFGAMPVSYTAMVMMRMPFFSWNKRQIKASTESLYWKSESLRAKKAVLLNRYENMAHSLHTRLTAQHKQRQIYEEDILPALHNRYQTISLGYAQNTDDLLKLYDALTKINNTRLAYLDLLLEILITQTSLDSLIEER